MGSPKTDEKPGVFDPTLLLVIPKTNERAKVSTEPNTACTCIYVSYSALRSTHCITCPELQR